MRSRSRSQRSLQWATLGIDNSVPTVTSQQSSRFLSQHASNFAPLPINPSNLHVVIGGRLMTQPGDYRRLSTLLNRNPFRPGDRSTANRSRMTGHRLSKTRSNIRVA
jgi:hypothetical protein